MAHGGSRPGPVSGLRRDITQRGHYLGTYLTARHPGCDAMSCACLHDAYFMPCGTCALMPGSGCAPGGPCMAGQKTKRRPAASPPGDIGPPGTPTPAPPTPAPRGRPVRPGVAGWQSAMRAHGGGSDNDGLEGERNTGTKGGCIHCELRIHRRSETLEMGPRAASGRLLPWSA